MRPYRVFEKMKRNSKFYLGLSTLLLILLSLKNRTAQASYRIDSSGRNHYAFAAVDGNGSVVTWGSSHYGGNSSSVSSLLRTGVQHIYSTARAFAALKQVSAP